MQEELLKFRLPTVMPIDSHVGEDGKYLIRSLYFDDYDNSCYYDNESGIDPREKFRIRIYNGSTDRIRLELKRKQSGKTLKKSCPMTVEQVEKLIADEALEITDDMPPLLKQLCLLNETRGMKPKVIVEYERIPYVYPDDNVRITLDLNLRTSTDLEDFLKPTIDGRPIMPIGHNLLEVKYDGFLPDYIYRTIQLPNLQQTAFSKYYLCRKFGGII